MAGFDGLEQVSVRPLGRCEISKTVEGFLTARYAVSIHFNN